MVNDVLNDLVTRDLLYCGDGERIFFETKRSSMVKTYLKFIPTTEDEPRFRDSLLELYNIQYEDYIKQFDQASLLPAKSSLTPFGRDYIRKPQYAPIMNKKYCFVTPDKQLNTSNDETDVAREETQLNRQGNILFFFYKITEIQFSMSHGCVSDNDLRSLPLVDVNHHDQHELLTCNADKTIQHSSILGANQCIQTTKATDHILTIQENVVKDINDIQNRNLLLSSAVAIPRISTTPKTCAIATEQDENSVLLKKDEFYALQNQPTVSDDCDQTTLENVDLNTWHDRPLNVTTPEDVNNDHDDILTKNSELDGITDDLKQSSSEAAGQLDKILEATQNDQEKIVGKTMDINKKILAGKALLIPSIVLTKGLIGLHIRAPAKDINDALEYLVAEELLKKDKYLQARNHPIESYLKCLPKDFDNISNKYLLQRKLSEPQVTVDKYLDSLKTIKYATLVQCPTSILINVLQTPPYDQFQIDLSSKRKANRNTIIIDLLRECTGEKLEQWTPITIEQSLMAINALGFLNRVEEKLLDTKLNTYLTSKGCSNMIVEPYIKKCCDTKLKMIIGRKIIIFKIDGSYTGTLTYGNCLKCMKQYSHNYFMYQDKKYVTYDSVFSSNLVYLGGNYGYDKKFIRWLSNSILYLYSGFENFAKCYNATNNQISKTVDTANINLCPTRIQDFWFLYNFINISFFYTESTILQVPSNCDRQKLVEFMNTNYDRLNKHFVNYWALHKEHHSCGTTCSMAFVTDGFQKSSRFICGNIKMVVRSKELGYVQVGCGNRPEYEAKHKRKQDNQCKSITTSTNGSNDDTTDALCRSCKLNPISHDVEEEIITNNECNINRNPRF
ncbi:unnamed protein product, partial [Adineta steineri]